MNLDKFNNIRFGDFETSTTNTKYWDENKDSRVNLWTYTKISDVNDDDVKVGATIDGFIKTIIDDVNNFDGDEIIIYFHNLKFDIRFIYCYGIRFLNWKVINGNPSSSKKATNASYKDFDNLALNKNTFGDDTTFIKFLGKETKPNGLLVKLPNHKKIRFRCSLAIIPMNLEQIGKSLGIDKHNETTISKGFYDVEPSNNINDYPKEYIEYAIRDVIILKKYFIEIFLPNLIKHQDNLGIVDEFKIKNIPSTLASYSFKLQLAYLKSKRIFKNVDDVLFLSGEQEQLARNFYLGGLTLFNPLVLKKEFPNCCYIDINSSYPFSMTKPLPYGAILKDKPNGVDGEHYLTYYKIYVKKAKIKNRDGLHPLQNWKDKLKKDDIIYNNFYSTSCIDVLYNFDCYYLKKEWELMQEFYNFDYEIVDTYYIKCKAFLKDYINILYEFKANAPTKGDRDSAKLLLNSGYGKYGENQNYNLIYFCVSKEQQDFLLNSGEMKHKAFYKKIINKTNNKEIAIYDNQEYKTQRIISSNIFYDIDDKKLFPISLIKQNKKCVGNPNVFIASTITSYSRCLLLETILKCGNKDGNVLYCDTDSLILKDESFLKNVDVDDKKLGAWKVEHNNINAIIFGKKLYKIHNDKIEINKAKGVAKDIKAKTLDALFNTKDNYVVSSKKQLIATKSGWVIDDVDVELNTNPITSQLKNIKHHKEILDLSIDDIGERIKGIMENVRDNTNIFDLENLSNDIWENLKYIDKNFYKDEIHYILNYSIYFNYEKSFTFNDFRKVILGSINNFVMNLTINKVKSIKLIDVLNDILKAYKQQLKGESLISQMLDKMLSYTLQGELFDISSSQERLTIMFNVCRDYDNIAFLIEPIQATQNRQEILQWLIDNNIFNNSSDANDFLNYCCWKEI